MRNTNVGLIFDSVKEQNKYTYIHISNCYVSAAQDLKPLSIRPCLFQADPSPSAVEKASSSSHVTWLNQRKVKSFYRGVVATELRSGVNALLQVRISPLFPPSWSGVCLTKPACLVGVNARPQSQVHTEFKCHSNSVQPKMCCSGL